MPSAPARILASLAALAFIVLTVLIAVGGTAGVDVPFRDALRPGDVWGPTQVRVDIIVESLKPSRVLMGFAALVLAVCLARRCWRPLVFAGALLGGSLVPAIVVKRALERPDPHRALSSMGSFPSGHMLVLLVCLGGALRLVVRRPRWWHWLLVAAVDALMGASLLLQAAHWVTDVTGGVLLGVMTLALSSGVAPLPSSSPQSFPRRRDPPAEHVVRGE